MTKEEIERDIQEMVKSLEKARINGPYVLGFQGKWYDLDKESKLPEDLLEELKELKDND